MSVMAVFEVLLAIPNCEVRTVFRSVIERSGDAKIHEAEDYHHAIEHVRMADSLRLVIADLHMSSNPQDDCGRHILTLARERFGRSCYNVLVSASHTSRMQFADLAGENEPYEFFLSTRYIDHDPIKRLGEAVEIARDHALRSAVSDLDWKLVRSASPNGIEV